MMAQRLIEELKHAKGAVVNVTSIAGSRRAPFAGVAYATSKAALASLTREMASDFGRVGVRVSSIAPGEIDTSILSPGTEKIVEQQIPMHRLGTPDEVAKIIYVLCTEQFLCEQRRDTSTAASTFRAWRDRRSVGWAKRSVPPFFQRKTYGGLRASASLPTLPDLVSSA